MAESGFPKKQKKQTTPLFWPSLIYFFVFFFFPLSVLPLNVYDNFFVCLFASSWHYLVFYLPCHYFFCFVFHSETPIKRNFLCSFFLPSLSIKRKNKKDHTIFSLLQQDFFKKKKSSSLLFSPKFKFIYL